MITLSSMSSQIVRVSLLFLLVLQMLHLPLPCPDLDGECRGTPILSLMDLNAWHVLIAGVMPNADIDRGPFRSEDSQQKRTPSDSPYGDLALTDSAGSGTGLVLSRSFEVTVRNIDGTTSILEYLSLVGERRIPLQNESWTLDARTLLARVCIWRI